MSFCPTCESEWPQNCPEHGGARKPASEAVGVHEPMPRTFERRTLAQKLSDAWQRAIEDLRWSK